MDEVSLTINGRIIGGFADGDDVITTEFNEEQYALTVGAGGDTFRTKVLNETARMTINLLQSAEDNDFLEDLYNTDRLSNTGVVPVRMTDLNTGRKYTMPLAWIVQGSAPIRGAGHNARTWIIETDKLIMGAN